MHQPSDARPVAHHGDHADLRQVVGEQELARLALESVQALDENRPGWHRHASHDFEPRMMLTLLSYCYASGIYGSARIADSIRHDRMIRYLCARTYPNQAAIRSFRRDHGGLLRQCLRRVFQTAWGLRLDPASTHYYGYSFLETQLNARVDVQIQHRLDVAIFIDHMELGED